MLSTRAQWAAGQPIGELMAQALQYPELVSLAAGFVDNATLPCAEVVACFEQLSADASRLRASLQYDTTAGSRSFREVLAQWAYHPWPQARPAVEQLIATAGSNQLLHLITEALIDPGDIVVAAAPTYFVFMGTLKGAGARVFGVSSDEDGMQIEALKETLEQLDGQGLAKRVKAIYLVPDYDNPAGSTLSMQRRQELLELVERWNREKGALVVLWDNAYQLLRYDGEELPPLSAIEPSCRRFVVELGTFSKSFAPGIRVGWGVVPSWLLAPVLEIKANIDFGSAHFNQVLMEIALRDGLVDAHLPAIVATYRSKRDTMLTALEESMGDLPGVQWRHPRGGLYVWLTLPNAVDAAESGLLWRIATKLGVLYVPGVYCFPTEGYPPQRNSIRLSFGVQSHEGIRRGVQMLSQAIRQTLTATV
ncbi:MAG: aminotransferase [Pirellulaceae bacterium]|nr:MAG: aminotransferase [Pirellulaceae bacterium]